MMARDGRIQCRFDHVSALDTLFNSDIIYTLSLQILLKNFLTHDGYLAILPNKKVEGCL